MPLSPFPVTPPPDPGAESRRAIDAMTRKAQRGIMVFYLLDTLLLGGFAWQGMTPPWLPVAYLGAGLAAWAVVLHALNHGWFWRVGETRVVLWQSLYATAVVLAAAAAAPRTGVLCIVTALGVVSVAAIRLPIGLLLGLSGVTLAGVALVLTLGRVPPALALDTAAQQVLTVAWVGMLLLKTSALSLVGAQMRSELAGANERLLEALRVVEALAAKDDLTGLLNRRSMMQVLQEQLREQARLGGVPFAVALLDIDHFKQVNDHHGHAVGDRVLRTFADLAREALPPTRPLSRHGGEEFLLLLRDVAEVDAARQAVELLRRRVQDHAWASVAEGLAITLSAGVALQQPGEALPRLLERTDAALYRAKAGGRNRVEVAVGPAALHDAPAPAATGSPTNADTAATA
jgi:diguanylate cyclase (GGDEF)-like protein